MSTILPENGSNRSELVTQLESDIKAYVERHPDVAPYSLQEYFMMLAEKALETLQKGNYGIAASIILRHEGHEYIIFGQNGMKNPGNPHGHAEMDAVATGVSILQATQQGDRAYIDYLIQKGKLIIREAPHQETEEILLTTLEPCPMCTVGSAIYPNFKTVIIGAADELAGALLPERLSGLAQLWQDQASAHNLIAQLAQGENPAHTETYLDPQLLELLMRLFFETREELDQDLANGQLFTASLIAPALFALGYTQNNT